MPVEACAVNQGTMCPALGYGALPVPGLPKCECFFVQIVLEGVGEWEQCVRSYTVFPEEGLCSLDFVQCLGNRYFLCDQDGQDKLISACCSTSGCIPGQRYANRHGEGTAGCTCPAVCS